MQSVKEIFNEIKGITPRPEQVRLAEAIFMAFERKRYALYESPTGTGKTLAMLVASALVAQKYKNNAISYAISSGRAQQTLGSSKVVIATPTKDLQMQIMDEFSKWIKPIFPDLKIAIIKGKSNYIDKYELHAAINRAEDEEEKEKLIQFSEAVETCGGDIDMLTDISDKLGIDIEDFQYSPSYYHLEKDTFRDQNGNQIRPDYYFLCACDKAKAADIVVTNHAFFIAYNWYQNKKTNRIEIAKIKGSTNEMDEAEMRLLFEVDGIPFAFDNVIIDEAHTYPSRVVRMLASEIAFSYIARTCNEIATYLKKYKNRDKKITYDMINDVEKQAKKIDSIAEAIEDAASSSDVRGYMQVSQLIQSNTKLGNEMIEQIPKVFKALSKIHDNVMKTSIIPVAKKYKILEALRVTKTTQAIIDDVLSNSKYKKFKKEVRSQQHNSHVAIFFLFSEQFRCPSVASLNPIPNGATRYIAEVYNSVVAMSGTLTSSTGSFDTIAKRLGLYDRMPITDVFKGFNLKRMVKLHLYPDNPEPYDENIDLSNYIEANKENINRIIRYACGRVLILCPAYKDVDMWREVIQTNKTVIIQGKGSGISSFKGSMPEDCVIIAVNAWEGVDIDGLSDVVITRIPNVHPDDIMYIAAEAVYESFFQSRAKKANVFAIVNSQKKYDAFIKTRQGMGRLIRKETDSGNIYIFDPRALQWEEWFVDHYTVVKHKIVKADIPVDDRMVAKV